MFPGENEDEVWKDHIQHEDVLRTYASAMHSLATNHWESTQVIRWCIEKSFS